MVNTLLCDVRIEPAPESHYRGNIFSRFCSDSSVNASESLENLDELFLKPSTSEKCVTHHVFKRIVRVIKVKIWITHKTCIFSLSEKKIVHS